MNNDSSTKPIELTFIRHGLSEPNIVQGMEKAGEPLGAHVAVYDRHDSEQRLVPAGRRQAATARQWMLDNDLDPDGYDARFVSTHVRTMETAVGIGSDETSWFPDSKLVERDWGTFGATPLEERRAAFEREMAMSRTSSFYARHAGGESNYDVTFRIAAFIATLARKHPRERVLAVTHGEVMWAARYAIERQLPHEWQGLDADKSLRITNCMILQYTRRNPFDPNDVVGSLSAGWRRLTNPIDPSTSPYDGAWVRLPGRRLFTGAQLSEIVSLYPQVLDLGDDL